MMLCREEKANILYVLDVILCHYVIQKSEDRGIHVYECFVNMMLCRKHKVDVVISLFYHAEIMFMNLLSQYDIMQRTEGTAFKAEVCVLWLFYVIMLSSRNQQT